MILIALGANIASPAGPPAETLRRSLRALEGKSVAILKVSPFYKTLAWPDPIAPVFVNAAASLATAAPPDILLKQLHEVETEFGRKRSIKNAPRPLDLDLLDYDGRIAAGLPRLPHPGIEERAFVLVPLRDVAPDWHHPVSNRGVEELIAALPPGARAGVRRLGRE